jgi:hypothetical protein
LFAILFYVVRTSKWMQGRYSCATFNSRPIVRTFNKY